ncbi:b-box zinc finger [Ancylostoma caninum]|uniref:B-box zinc finger n=1 Tax=Ancylostoma caninum TaxID=29170 RepID=A0A368HCR8_ANCCA|nr:b-box zinc finger [Ancylostoma caninum]
MDSSPLDCNVCGKELTSPHILPCLHSICASCSPCCSTSTSCGSPDPLAEFLIETAHETTEMCANCDQTNQPMYFCETCQQALCHECKATTHQARMFASHRIVVAEESARVRGRVACAQHSEPYILYCTDQKCLACIQCFNDRPSDDRHYFVSVDAGHKTCMEKIEKWAMKLRLYQEEKREELEVRQRLLAEQSNNYQTAKESLYQLCQQIHDTVLSTRDRLALELEKGQEEAERTCKEQIQEITAIMGPIRLCLMSAQILCSSASPIDVLQLSSELSKRVQSILSRAIDKLPAARTIDPIEARTEIAKALEPFLGLSAAWCPIAVAREGSQEGSGSMKSYKTRSGSHSMPTMLSKFQTMIDLSGAFGSIFARVEEPLKQLSIDLSQLGERVQEAQRDLTMRRCAGVETRLGLHSAVLNDLQPELQQMWQEQLDRVRRQQIIYREKVEECFSMRETARHVLTAAKQLVPYAACIESMSALIDPKRCHPPDPAPMESICMQITGIEPNSESRIQAIEKEEQNRRAVQEAKKREELAERGTPVKGLKHAKANRKDTNRLLVNTNRERSPGGTDSTLISPCLLKRISPSVREETTSDLEMESAVWRENFELTGEEKLETADLAIQEEERCSSSLSLTAQPSGQPAALPSLEQLLGRSPLASRITVDIGVSHQSMLQSLHDVFASQRSEGETPVCEEPSMLASAVKIAQKMHQIPAPAVRSEPKTVEEPSDSVKKTRKERRRRKKRSGDAAESREDAVVESSVAVAEAMPVPDVPYVPSRVFDASDMPLAKLGSFEAKEKMLRSLREKMARSDDSS